MIKRLFKPPTTSYFLFGPRGTGKSTWLKEKYPTALYIDLLDHRIFRQLSAYPEQLEERILGQDRTIVIIDEIQKVPELLNTIHRLIEKKAAYQFILTGSSARKLKKTHANLLAGRAILKKFHPFVATELGDAFSLDNALSTGLLPLVWNHDNPQDTLSSYIDLHLKEEIQQEGLTRNVGNFARFLENISFSHAGVLNMTNIARECDIHRKVVCSYLEILEDLLLASQLYPFTKRAKRHLTAHPKFYFFDTGVFSYLRPRGPLDSVSDIHGQALEGLVYQHLVSWCDRLPNPHSLSFWRTKSGLEVDFIIYGETHFQAIEVKNSSTVHSKDLAGLREFKKDYPEAELILLYRGGETLKKGDVLCQPVADFLRSLMY